MHPFDNQPSNSDGIGRQTVPDRLIGCWKRAWIRFGEDGVPERHEVVFWLQTASGMADLRTAPGRLAVENDSSCGRTIVDETTTPFMTADWEDGDSGFSQQEVSRYPEKGWLSWHDDTVMHELAPSGAYVEEWHRLEGSEGIVTHHRALDAKTTTNLYRSGRHVLLAIHRDCDAAVHEFSYGTISADDSSVQIQQSTLDARVGLTMQLDYDWHLVSERHLS